VGSGRRFAAALVDDVNVTHADIAEEYLGRPAGADLDCGLLWVARDHLEYETHSTTLADDELEPLLGAWAARALTHSPSCVRRRSRQDLSWDFG
jgi:hypothetical protein